MAVIAAVAAFGIWAGLFAAPASASQRAWQPHLNTATVAASVGIGVQTAAVVNGCSIHDWYYRIYLVGSGQTLFRWNFEVSSCISDDRKYWTLFLPDDSVALRNPVIQGSTVAEKTVAPNGIKGSISVLYLGATFNYCPNGTCIQTFQPRLGWIYGLDGSRVYVGDVPLV
ncbi:MAG TPA: hypothetical protein VGR06_25045 [Actinophytocola sp.]|jgi:hypothetical protein|uniref:hypothetical protein n=1 Tax=Actinophytocola sp. TaxID=1872138 RepID=UPI002E08E70F|nr:hypothetical protein [Actinophytocola sp.]